MQKLLSTIVALTDRPNTCHRKETGESSGNHTDSAEKMPDILDESVLRSIEELSNDQMFISTLITGFIEDASKLTAEMQQALSIKDYLQFGELMHALKGSAGSLGATMLHQLCTEEPGKSRTPLEYINLLKKIIGTLEQTRCELQLYLQAKGMNTSTQSGK